MESYSQLLKLLPQETVLIVTLELLQQPEWSSRPWPVTFFLSEKVQVPHSPR